MAAEITNINAAKAKLVTIDVGLQAAIARANGLTGEDYTTDTWANLATALVMPETTNLEKTRKLYEIELAIGGLSLKAVSGTTITLQLQSYDFLNDVSTPVSLVSGVTYEFSITNMDGSGTVDGVTFVGASDGTVVMTFTSDPSVGNYMILGDFIDGSGSDIHVMTNFTI
jgi:hypothetical protein